MSPVEPGLKQIAAMNILLPQALSPLQFVIRELTSKLVANSRILISHVLLVSHVTLLKFRLNLYSGVLKL